MVKTLISAVNLIISFEIQFTVYPCVLLDYEIGTYKMRCRSLVDLVGTQNFNFAIRIGVRLGGIIQSI